VLTSSRADSLLALDYDGTLAPIVLDPAAARPQSGARAALAAAAGVFGRVALVSGRAASSLVELLDLTARDAPAVTVIGVHGRESWPPEPTNFGLRPRPSDAPEGRRHTQKMKRALGELEALVASLPAGVRIEDKGHSLGVHLRGCADAAAAAVDSTAAVRAVAQRCGLEVLPGRLVLELLEPGPDKGTALRDLVGDARAVCFVGDDVADLAAFAVVDQLRAAGVPGLKVAVANPESPAPAAAADLVLADPGAVVNFLTAITGGTSRDC
jgi:trehalose 6-phosphate phosphatase